MLSNSYFVAYCFVDAYIKFCIYLDFRLYLDFMFVNLVKSDFMFYTTVYKFHQSDQSDFMFLLIKVQTDLNDFCMLFVMPFLELDGFLLMDYFL